MADTNVPLPTLTDRGFVPPTEAAILAGRKQDYDDAFGTELNFGNGAINPTPQGQLVASDTAIIGNANDNFCDIVNSVDPAFASGRMQDAIARIYFLERLPGQSTVVDCLCIGAAGTLINAGTPAQSVDGNIYTAISGGIIPIGGSITLAFECQTIGAIACPADTLNKIYRTIPGWDTINNPSDGVLGSPVESRIAFETRRQASVALNSVGFNDSVLGSVLSIAGVLDAYVIDNPNVYPVAYTPDAVVVGSITATTLTIISVTAGIVEVGQSITGSSGLGIAVAAGTVIVSDLGGGDWEVNHSQTVAQTTLLLGGVVLGPNSLYVGVVGGDQTEVATAIWSKKSPGCPYFAGNTTVTIYDTNVQYPPPGVPYPVTFETVGPLPVVMQVNIANGPTVPSDAAAQIQAAVIGAFAGADGRQRVKIGAVIYANRFYAPINALGTWAEIVSLFLGTQDDPAARGTATIGANFTATGSGTSLTVSAIGMGRLSIGDAITGPGVPANTVINSQSSGSAGGTGVYITNNATTSVAAALVAASSVMNVTVATTGTFAVGQYMFDDAGNINEGSAIASLGTGSGGTGTYNLSGAKQTVASEAVYAVLPNLTRVGVSIDQAPTISTAIIQVNLV